MRQRYSPQADFNVIPIEKIVLPTKSRDELPPILAGLQWIWTHPTLKAELFALLEARILAGKKATGRIGMDLWQILVLGVVRLGLDADWDRLEDLANHHKLIRQMLGRKGRFVTQMFFPDEPLNAKDSLFTMPGETASAATGVMQTPGPDMEPDSLHVPWDIILFEN